MLTDGRQIPEGTVLDTDLCIVGSGPAALALAGEFQGSSVRVLLLEAGSVEPEIGDGVEPRVGGWSNRWVVQTEQSSRGIRLLPLAETDFEPRAALPDAEWPIRRADLDPFYRRAQDLFGLKPAGYEVADWEEPWARALPLGSTRLRSGVFQFGIGEAVSRHLDALARSGNVTLCHHAAALELLSDDRAAHVTGLRVASAPGREWQVRAEKVVLAGGGHCAAELLLASDRVQPAGLGNAHDVVGRYYMDHPLILGGEFVPATPRLFEALTFYDLRTVAGTSIMGHLTLDKDVLRREPVLNLSFLLYPRGSAREWLHNLSPRQQQGFDAARRLRRRLALQDLGALAAAPDGVFKGTLGRLKPHDADLNRGGWSQRPGAAQRYDRFEVLHQAEQAPHPDNRLVLTGERDALGRRLTRLDWRWHPEDMAATMRAQDIFAEDLRRSGLGEFRIRRSGGAPSVIHGSTMHFLGATRMSDDPRSGVVNRDGRVHGVDNLFVASGSVFPTGGFANPTLTIAALALRLADHLKTFHARALASVRTTLPDSDLVPAE